jgi:type IV pilus assembly protein PilV
MEKSSHSSRLQRGFSMIEVLVAIVVLAFGLLAVVGVQLEALRGNQSASQTAIAASLVRDYQEVLTSMPSVTATSSADKVSQIDKGVYTAYGSDQECKGASATCTNTQYADFQNKEWIARVQSSLPSGTATVCFDNAYKETTGTSAGLYKWACSNSGDILVVKIGWAAKLGKTQSGATVETGIDDGTSRPRIVVPVTGNQEGYKL